MTYRPGQVLTDFGLDKLQRSTFEALIDCGEEGKALRAKTLS